MSKRERDLDVLTRASGVRKENPLLKLPPGDKYYLPSKLRTPALRKEADELLKPVKLGMKIQGKRVKK
jgi:hypothetical protein